MIGFNFKFEYNKVNFVYFYLIFDYILPNVFLHFYPMFDYILSYVSNNLLTNLKINLNILKN